MSECPFPYSSSTLVETSEEQDECIIGRQQKACTKISCAHRQTLSQIAKEEICDDSGSNISIKRTGNRVTNFPPVEYIESTVPEAMAKLHDYVQPSLHHYQSNINQKSKTTINDQLLIRINKENDMAEPTPEGIHQDGTEISSITLISRKNVLKGKGGESRLWKVEQPTGNYDSDEFGELQNHASNAKPNGFSWDNCLFDKVLETPWETILFNDRKVKHEARMFFRDEDEGPCYRDVIVNLVRKPLSDGSDTKLVDGNRVESVL